LTKGKQLTPHPVTGAFVEMLPPELLASAYVQDARSGFGASPAGALSFGPTRVRAPLPGKQGRRANSTGRPIGGGRAYGDWIAPRAEGFVRTLADLDNALRAQLSDVQAAIANDTPLPRKTIFVAADAEIEIGAATLGVPPGVTLASTRGREGSLGGLIRSSSDTVGRSFVILAQKDLATTRALPPVRITGLRFEGPNPHEDAPDLLDCSSAGRTAIYAHEVDSRDDPASIVNRVVEIDNNAFGAWPAVAIEIGGIRGGYVHHNYIHHSQRNAHSIRCAVLKQEAHALGYGVVINNGLVYIEANIFKVNRHAIASRGDKFTDYIAMYNELGEPGPSHHFDVHGGEDREDGTHIAGRTIVIAYNTDRGAQEAAVNIRGNPVQGAYITGNEFRANCGGIKQTKTVDGVDRSACDGIKQPKAGDAVTITAWNNVYGFTESDGGTPGPGRRGGVGNPQKPK
jgi:hypothetical protein